MKSLLIIIATLFTINSYAGTKLECYETHVVNLVESLYDATNSFHTAYKYEAASVDYIAQLWASGINGTNAPATILNDEARERNKNAILTRQLEVHQKVAALNECLRLANQ